VKKIVGQIKLQCPAGKANPSPPVGPALGQHGVNIMEFCKQFNARTQKQAADNHIIPVVITVYADRSFSFVTKSPPAARLLLKAAKIEKGAQDPKREKVGRVTRAQIEEIVKMKGEDLTASDLEAGVRTVSGTARSMGIEVVS